MTILKQDDRRAAKIASQAIARVARAPGTLVRAVGRALRPSTAPSPSRELAPVRPALPPAPPPPAIDPDPIFAETASWAGRALILSFIGAVVGPTFLAMLYFGLLASDQFVSEIRLSVRAASEQRQQATDALSAFSKLGLAAAKTSTQDAYMVVNYVRSKPAVVDVGGPDFLEKVYSKPEIDWFSRLSPGEPLENIWKYWNRHVVASLDTLSSIVTVKVFAYTPEDAQALAARIVEASEKLVNTVSERSRSDALRQAEKELEGAQAKLVDTRSAMLDYRNRNVTIDPLRKAEDIGKMIVELTLARVQLQNTLASYGDALSATAPSVRANRSRIEELDRQIDGLKQQLTTTDQGVSSVSGALAEYERLKLGEQFAERLYQIALMAHERSLQEARRQQLYLSTIVRPTLPERALYPERLASVLLTFMCAFVLWGIFSMLGATVVDHLT